MKFKFFKKSFTLAEVVMVMGIIGIVAMLTVTNARKDTDVAEKVMQLKKCDEIISAAFAQAVAENGNIITWGENGVYPDKTVVWNIISSYLKLQKNCGVDNGCWRSGNIGSLPSSDMDPAAIESDCVSGILSNGASVAIGRIINPTGDAVFDIFVDVDGPNKGTYRFGDDVFGFYITNEGEVFPDGFNNLTECRTSQGVYCTAWVLTFGNQDYLKKCGETLNWDTKQSCK